VQGELGRQGLCVTLESTSTHKAMFFVDLFYSCPFNFLDGEAPTTHLVMKILLKINPICFGMWVERETT